MIFYLFNIAVKPPSRQTGRRVHKAMRAEHLLHVVIDQVYILRTINRMKPYSLPSEND